MGGSLCETALAVGHLGIAVGVTADILSGEYFIPYACCGISSVCVVEMISVAAERVPQTRRTTILDCRSAIYHLDIHPFFICYFLHKSCARLDGVPHDLLVGLIAWICRMFGVPAIRPSLHPTELCLWLVCPDGVNKHG